MPFAENLAAFYGPDDPGVVAALYGVDTVYGEFKAAYVDPLTGVDDGGGRESAAPHFWCAVADVSGIKHGDALAIDGNTYKIRGVQPDGTGIVQLRLARL